MSQFSRHWPFFCWSILDQVDCDTKFDSKICVEFYAALKNVPFSWSFIWKIRVCPCGDEFVYKSYLFWQLFETRKGNWEMNEAVPYRFLRHTCQIWNSNKWNRSKSLIFLLLVFWDKSENSDLAFEAPFSPPLFYCLYYFTNYASTF